MQNLQDSNMQDRCRILYYSEVRDDAGARWVYTPGSEIRCGLRISASVAFNLIINADEQGVSQVPFGDYSLRLPIDTVISPLDRIRITRRYGVDVADQDYEIVGPEHRGTSALVIKVKPIPMADYA